MVKFPEGSELSRWHRKISYKEKNKAVPPPPPPSKPKKAAKIVVALFPYTATNRDELSFAEGAQIEFIDHLEEGWATGRLMDTGKTGHYPTNFVEEMKKVTLF